MEWSPVEMVRGDKWCKTGWCAKPYTLLCVYWWFAKITGRGQCWVLYQKLFCWSFSTCRWLNIVGPYVTAMRRMLHICEKFASTFSVRFNASKSKCIVVEYGQTTNSVSSWRNVRFTIGGSDTETVDSWPHLGHVISCNLNDNLEIELCHHKLIAQVNSVLCNFVSVDAIVKMQNYCLSLYGCELWDLCHTGIERICKAWRMWVPRV